VRLIDLISTLKKKTDDPEYYVVKGDAFRLKGANEGGPAVSEYEKAIYIKNMARVHERIGKIFKAGKNYKEAQVSFNRAIEADSMFAPVYRSRGEMWLLARNYKNAAYNYKKYIDALQAGDARDVTPEVWLRYAKFAFLSKDLDGASKAMEKVQGISDTDIPRMKGYIANTKGNHEEAIKQLEELIAQLPEKKKLTQDYGTLGRSYAALKKSDEALANLAKAVADTNENYNMDIYNVIYQDKKNYKNAAEAYTKVIDWKQKQEEKVGTNDYLRLGMAYYFATSEAKKAKDSLAVLDLAPKADSAFSKIVQTNTSYKPAYLWRARTNLLLDSDHSKGGLSIPFYDKFIAEGDKEKNKKEVVEACKVVGGYYLLNKDDVKAMEYFKKGFELMPDDAVLKERVLGPATPPATTTPTPPATPVKKN
jgi:tetratricopeptide (TPR) repeat protein